MNCTRRKDSLWPRCQCPPCRTERNRMLKRWQAGLHVVVDRDAAIERVREWYSQGFTRQWIASACRLDPRAVDRILDRGSRPQPKRAARILQSKIKDGDSGFGPTVGISRRLQALTVAGWTLDDMHARTGIPKATLSDARSASVKYMRAPHWHAIVRMYDEIGLRKGPSTRGAARAAGRGWAPPLAWDDDTIDDPAAQPHIGRNTARTPEETAHEVEWYLRNVDSYATTPKVAARFGYSGPDGISAALRRAGRDDLIDRLTLNYENAPRPEPAHKRTA